MRYELQLQMWGRVKNVSKENVFLHSSKLVVFLLLTDEKRKKRRLMGGEKKMIEAMLCLDELIQFLHFSAFR